MTFEEYLTLLSDLDRAGEEDPPPMIPIDQVIDGLKDKVDAVYKVRARLKLEAERLREDAQIMQKAARTVMNHYDRISDYVANVMESHSFEKVPGKQWRVQLQDSPPSVQAESPVAEDFLENPDLVKREVVYTWRTDVVKQRLLAGDSIPGIKLTQGKHLRFYANKGES